MGIDPLLLLAIILGAIGTVGTVLSSILTTQQIVDRVRAKSEARHSERIEKTKLAFEALLPGLTLMDSKFTSSAAIELIRTIRDNKDKILGYQPILRKEVPEIAREMRQLLAIVRKTTHGMFSAVNVTEAREFMQDKRTKSLVSDLRENIEEWLSDHA